MNEYQRNQNLARARKIREQKRRTAERERATAHRKAVRVYRAACATYYRVRHVHGEGSPPERKAFRKMLTAEVKWFETYPRD